MDTSIAIQSKYSGYATDLKSVNIETNKAPIQSKRYAPPISGKYLLFNFLTISILVIG